MLKSVRKNTKIIVWTVIIAFACWGGYSLTELRHENLYAGKVFGKNISFQEFEPFRRSSLLFSDPETIRDPKAVRQGAWQSVIFSQQAKKQNIEVTDEEVRKEIIDLLERHKIALENYEKWLEGIPMNPPLTPNEFEAQIRERLRIQKWVKTLEDSAADTPITDEEAKKMYFQENNKLSLEILHFPTEKEAKEFRGKIKKPADWEKTVESKRDQIKQTGLVGTEQLPFMLQVSPEDFEKIKNSEVGMVTEPIASGQEWAVIRIADKTTTTEQRFEEEKVAYLKSLKERQTQMMLMTKTSEIIAEAKLEDFQPSN